MKKKLIALLLSLTFIFCLFSCGEKGSTATPRCETCTFGAWTTTVQPTCQTEGTEVRTCSVCNYKESRLVPISPSSHKFGAWTTTASATCQTTGTEVRTCSVCNYKESKTIPISPSSHKAVNGICTYCQKITNAYDALVYYVKQNGSYDSSDRDYTLVTGSSLIDGSTYGRFVNYDLDDSELSIAIFCSYGAVSCYLSITIEPNSNTFEYGMVYSNASTNEFMFGSIYPKTFSKSTTALTYTSNTAPASVKPTLAELGASTTKLLLTFLDIDLAEYNITAKDLGFVNF